MVIMITRLVLKNFKGLREADIDLAPAVVFIGPNNSGKTSALQAIALWDIGLKAWYAKRGADQRVLKRSGVTINRRDLIALPVPNALLLWNDLHVRGSVGTKENRVTENVLIEIWAEGVTNDKKWECGFEFDYANPESLYCRPLRKTADAAERYPLPEDAVVQAIRVAMLPPMSGLASVEPKWEHGRINVLIGEGQTAQVLRNLCLAVAEDEAKWENLKESIGSMFGVTINLPEYLPARGEVVMSYSSRNGIELDLSSSGRGLQQTLLILSYLYANPNTIILLDEPDAHLEILRQRQIYHTISELAKKQGSQIICASHSEVVLDEAVERDQVIAFVGKPHTINDRQQVLKALRDIGFQDYYLAEEKGWILYLEGSTDLAILKSLARKLGHKAETLLDTCFVKYLGNNLPRDAEKHFYALREACPNLTGLAVFDRIENPFHSTEFFIETMWEKREIENYICRKDSLYAFIGGAQTDDLFAQSKRQIMNDCIADLESALHTLKKPSPWSDDCKVTDDFLDPLFENYLSRMNLPANSIRKRSYFELAEYIRHEDIDPEVTKKLDMIVKIGNMAKPQASDF
jgi:hypothetical protein